MRGEVCVVAANWHLPAEMVPLPIELPEHRPELLFKRGRIVSKLSCSRDVLCSRKAGIREANGCRTPTPNPSPQGGGGLAQRVAGLNQRCQHPHSRLRGVVADAVGEAAVADGIVGED